MEKKNIQEPKWYKEAMEKPSTVQFIDEVCIEYEMEHNESILYMKKPVRFHYVGNDKVVVIFDDDTREDYSVVEAEIKFG
jgi:hypothetical protein